MFDLSSEEMQAIKERAEMRNTMRKAFQKKIASPYRGVNGYIVSALTFNLAFVLGLAQGQAWLALRLAAWLALRLAAWLALRLAAWLGLAEPGGGLGPTSRAA